MIERCLSERIEGEFGILWLSDDELKQVGCACEITEVLERMDDGRLNILVRGTRPFRLIERRDDSPTRRELSSFSSTSHRTPPTGTAERSARALYQDLVMQATDRELEDAELAELDSYRHGRDRRVRP